MYLSYSHEKGSLKNIELVNCHVNNARYYYKMH